MATQQATEALQAEIAKALDFKQQKLEARSEWGSINFEKASPDYRRIFELLSHLRILPLENLTDAAVTQIQAEIKQVTEIFGRVDAFSVEQSSPPQVRDALVADIHSRADQFYTVASPWIPFLAYQKGDVAKNIEALTASVSQAQTLIENAKTAIGDRHAEIETIITRAREASAAAGAAVFTKDFQKEAEELDEQAGKWLRAAAGLAGLTLLFAMFVVWLNPVVGDDPAGVIQKFSGKLAALAVLFTATLWCGRTYKALKHLVIVNRHRALSLQTFQAFSSAASDESAKDAVLMEATRAIFGSTPTGYLDAKGGGESDLKIVEIAKTLGARGSAT